ncbi:unnamed protein product [Psylliodes chrysocephalus]|uniref:Uncharacterized protein n=1 Tax=Psylliodes chrysocephalus TaxID=3402493 RepID=A0A9P0GM23_9CUCU|nr:unnamed protein product [Psylliodes chrysocephala]
MESRGKRLVSMCHKNQEYEIHSFSSSPVPSIPEEFRVFDSLNTDDEYLPSDTDSNNSDAPLSLLKQSALTKIREKVHSPVQEENPGTYKIRKQRKSVKGKTRSKKLERKLKRNHGEVTESGKLKKARICQPLDSCRMKCREKFNEEREIIFKEYWGSGSYEKQLCSLKVSSNCSGIHQGDIRGKNPPKNKYTDDDIKKVTYFILKVPLLYQSHYSRRDSNKKYLPPYYAIAKLYNQYLIEPDRIAISRTKFEEIFHTMNIGIKRPSKDTCGKCDKLKIKINLSISLEEKAKLQEELNLHLKKVDDYYKSKSEDKILSKNDRSKKTITFHLQQCLPTPHLSSGITFLFETVMDI